MAHSYTIVGGSLIITPGMTQSEMDEVSTGIKSLVKDVLGQDAPDQFRQGLAQFALRWQQYRDANSGWLTRGLSGTYAKVQEYKVTLNQWRADFEALGKTATSKSLKVQKSIVEETAKAGLALVDPKNLKWIGLAAFGVGAAALTIYAMKD